MLFAPRDNPSRQTTGITPDGLKEVLEELEAYNLKCRLGRKYDQYQKEIPIEYRGINKYWWSNEFEEIDNGSGGIEQILSIYDTNPLIGQRLLLVRYCIQDEDGTPMLTLAAAEKHIQAARMEYDRQQRMAIKRPELVYSPKVSLPEFHRPNAAKEILDAKLNP